jgi:glyoxylase-like metal-dependent hydrolase (beta-lactamase superfamily II)
MRGVAAMIIDWPAATGLFRVDAHRRAEAIAGVGLQCVRTVGTLALAALLTGLVAPMVQAAAPKAGFQAPGFFRMQLGDFEVTSLKDASFPFPPSILKAEPDYLAPLIANDFPSNPPNFNGSVAGFLVNTGRQLILVDTGTGSFGNFPVSGRLLANLRAAGYQPEQVDLVLITHMRFDHVGGLVTKDGKRVFTNAVVRLAQAESEFWLSKEEAARAPKQMQAFFDYARRAAAPYQAAGRWKPFASDDELAPGVHARPLYGHTPGHTGYEFRSGSEGLIAWGDTLHVAPVQFEHPDIGVAFDIDGPMAVEQRLHLIDELATSGTVVAAPHIAFPGLGHILRKDGVYAWVPARYTP